MARNAGASETLVEVERIEHDTVFLKGGGLRRIVMVAGINFDLKSEEEQGMILGAFQNLLNALDFSIEWTIHSRKLSVATYIERLKRREEEEEGTPLLREALAAYREFIQSFVDRNAIMEKSFFVTVPYEQIAINPLAAGKSSAPSEEVIEALNGRVEQVIRGLHQAGLRAIPLNTEELRELFRNLYNPSSADTSEASGESLAPERAEVRPTHLVLNGVYAKTLCILTYPRYLGGSWFSPFINLPERMDISVHIHPTDTGIALKRLMRKVTELEVEMGEREERGEVRDPTLETAYADVETLRDSLQQSRDKLFEVSVYLTIYAESLSDLTRLESRITSMGESKLVSMKPLLFEAMDGFRSTLPIGRDALAVSKPLNSEPLSSLFPFISPDLTSNEGVLYGVNRHNNTLIIFDRFSLENANTVVFAKAGSGKSYATKLEVIRSLMMGTDILIIDPENEYEKLSEAVGGSMFKISLDSKSHINPFDIPTIPEDEEPSEVLRSHIVNLTGLMKLMLGEVTPEEEALLDRAITETYASRDIAPELDFAGKEPPLLEDLEVVLRSMEGGRGMADRLYRFTAGSYAGFTNKPTNIDVGNRLIVFSIRDLEDELRPIAMYIILNFVWNTVRAKLKKRIMIVDEAWWMMKYPDSAAFLFALAKRGRKYYLGITTITQDVEDFMRSPYGKPIITNSSLQLLLKQSPATVDITGQAFGLTEMEKNYLLEVDIGEGLFVAGLKHVAIQVIPSPFEHEIITTNPEEILEQRKVREA